MGTDIHDPVITEGEKEVTISYCSVENKRTFHVIIDRASLNIRIFIHTGVYKNKDHVITIRQYGNIFDEEAEVKLPWDLLFLIFSLINKLAEGKEAQDFKPGRGITCL